MTRRKHYVAVYERDRESDAWLVHIDGIEACRTYGRTLRQARERIEEALALWLDREPDDFLLEHRWPKAVNEVAAEVSEARTTAAEATQMASDATAGMAKGTWIRQKRSASVAPSTRAASDSSGGMPRKWARIQKTAKGMYKAISGNGIASGVL